MSKCEKKTYISCCICGSRRTEFVTKVESFFSPGLLLDLFRCRSCNSIFYPSTPTLSYHDEKLVEEKFYIEFEAGIPFLSHLMVNLKQLCSRKKQVRFLDVGCGLGFTVDMARFLGWDAVGVEPSPVGETGRKLFGVDIVTQYLQDTDFAENSFDAMLVTEVIEHVPEPRGFVQILSRYLSNEGVLCLTTPNAEAYWRESEGIRLEIVSPGAHICIFSPRAVGTVLKEVGFKECVVRVSEGTSGKSRLVVFATKAAFPTNFRYLKVGDRESVQFAQDYLSYLVAKREVEKDYLYDGALYRLIESHVNRGELGHAEKLCSLLDESLTQKYGEFTDVFFDDVVARAHAGKIRDYKEYISGIPSFLSRYLYYKGMICLNYLHDFPNAERYFTHAYKLFICEKDIFRFYANWDMCFRAKYHVGLAKLYSGMREESVAVFDEILTSTDSIPVDLFLQTYYSKGIAHLQLGQNLSALRMFFRTLVAVTGQTTKLLRQRFPLGLARLAVKHLFLALKQQYRVVVERGR